VGARLSGSAAKRDSRAKRGTRRYDRKGEYALAVRNFSTAIELDPTSADFYHNRGFAHRKQAIPLIAHPCLQVGTAQVGTAQAGSPQAGCAPPTAAHPCLQ
jgi:hypothetical protein